MEANQLNTSAIDRSIKRATLVGYIRATCAIPIYFFLTPFVLAALGKNYYGLWSLNTVILTFYALGDFGFQNSLVHFTAISLGDKPKLASLFNTIYFSFLLLAVGSFLCIFFFDRFLISSILKISPEYYYEARFVVASAAGMLFFRFLSSPYEAVLQGNQNVHYTQIGSFAWLLFNAAGTYVGLKIFPSIYSIGIINILGAMLLFIFYYVGARRRYSYTKLNPKLVNMQTIRGVLPYSMWIQLTSILISLREPFLKTIISRRFGLEGLAAFEIAYRLTVQGMSFVTVPLATTLSVSSLLRDRPEMLRVFVRKYMLWVSGILLLPCVLLWFFSDVFVRFWIGNQIMAVSSLLPWLFLAYSISYFTEPLFKTVQGLGRPELSAYAEIAFVIVLLMSLSWAPAAWGLLTVPYSLVLASILFSIVNILNYKSIKPAQGPRNSRDVKKFWFRWDAEYLRGYFRKLSGGR